MKPITIVATAAATFGGYWLWRNWQETQGRSSGDTPTSTGAATVASTFKLPQEPLATLVRNTEQANGIPTNLLARLLWQESRYKPTARNAASGAQGIAQIMPATAKSPGYGVPPIADPYDPAQAVPWAGKYLRAMRDRAGSWPLALAAYNWGLGNVQKKGMAKAPLETRNYVAQISADVPTMQA